MQFRNFLSTVLVIISVSCVALATPYPDPGNSYPGGGGLAPGQPTYPGNPPPPGYGGPNIRLIHINRNVVNETFPLRQLAGLGGQFQGWEIVAVRARTQPTNPGRTVAQLVADGQIVATQVNPGHQINLIPQTRLVLDQTVRTLRLAIGGGTFIESIQVEVRQGDGYNPPPPYGENVEVDVFRQVYGNDRIDLAQYVDLFRYRGRAIEQVVVTGSARYNGALVTLVINGMNIGQVQFSGGYSQRQTIWLRQPLLLGQGADSVLLYTSGDMGVEHVTLMLR